MSATGIQVAFPLGEQHRRYLQKDVSELPRVPAPIYRHAAPSAPWPWMDFDSDSSEVHPLLPEGLIDSTETWRKYPQNLFGNWTPDQVSRSKMLLSCNSMELCAVHKADVLDGGKFDKSEDGRTVYVTADSVSVNTFWEGLQTPRPGNIRVRALFVENMSLHALQMLGTRYNIEPFFFSSSANWIPSRYQEDPKPREGDHITVVLPFIRTMKNQRPIDRARPISLRSMGSAESLPATPEKGSVPLKDEKQIIDTQAPLLLPSDQILLQDLLAIHMVRTSTTSTIISYHPSSELQRTSAKRLQSLVQRTGDSVYWSKIFAKSKDPTFVFLAILWYALYAWDEAFEVLYKHINTLESRVLTTNDINLTRELHKLQAHLLYYQQLLHDFRKAVVFVKTTPNPAMEAPSITPQERMDSTDLMAKEADNLLSEIDRLDGQRLMQSDRLKNVMALAFATVNIDDSKAMQRLTEATMRDSAAMKQISYLTMVFLPASFIASVFGMNVMEINPGTKENLSHYAEATVALTLLTAWLVIALQTHSSFYPPGSNIWRRLVWPAFMISNLLSGQVSKISTPNLRGRSIHGTGPV
ncbi:hypothetical protein HYDPIDRAFT_113782 [Hydnomerulius pinastri MD-312]|uniref:Uncharacterized protein n=1 Tax=Hydnomerulius pinastri MD-312 TaxID=994086 RepID=A0A0C9VC57_9AGAM|nr:hypothetical protein HYDPIDRAFT_113782 [Hydnomerulius pinastri MD-312]